VIFKNISLCILKKTMLVQKTTTSGGVTQVGRVSKGGDFFNIIIIVVIKVAVSLPFHCTCCGKLA
jgi:hypothetical protein